MGQHWWNMLGVTLLPVCVTQLMEPSLPVSTPAPWTSPVWWFLSPPPLLLLPQSTPLLYELGPSPLVQMRKPSKRATAGAWYKPGLLTPEALSCPQARSPPLSCRG